MDEITRRVFAELGPGIEQQKASRKAKKAARLRRKATPDDNGGSGEESGLEFSDEVLARGFIEKHLADVRYTTLWGKWLMWDGRRWSPDEKLTIFSLAREHCYGQAKQAMLNSASRIAS